MFDAIFMYNAIKTPSLSFRKFTFKSDLINNGFHNDDFSNNC